MCMYTCVYVCVCCYSTAELYITNSPPAMHHPPYNRVITTPNLVHVMGLLGAKFSKEDAAKLMKILDTDKNGEVDYDEFRSFFLNR